MIFDASRFPFRGERDGVRIWDTPAGDELDLFYFALEPDLDADVHALEKIRQATRSRVTAAGNAIIEVENATIDGCLALRQIIKMPQKPHGIAYVGSFILPFRDFSFVIRVECEEHDLSGYRDSVIMIEALRDGRVTLDPDRKIMEGWKHDPYDPTLRGGYHWNLSEATEYDVRFPNHPLSRLRRVLAHLELTLRVTSEVRESPPFVFTG